MLQKEKVKLPILCYDATIVFKSPVGIFFFISDGHFCPASASTIFLRSLDIIGKRPASINWYFVFLQSEFG